MKHKCVIPRTQADRDVQEAVDYYLNEGAEQAALAIDVWRVLHSRRDIPAGLRESD